MPVLLLRDYSNISINVSLNRCTKLFHRAFFRANPVEKDMKVSLFVGIDLLGPEILKIITGKIQFSDDLMTKVSKEVLSVPRSSV